MPAAIGQGLFNICRFNKLLGGEQHQALDNVPELPDVAVQLGIHELFQGVWAELFALAVFFIKYVGKLGHKGGNVFFALMQVWHVNGNDIQPVVEVLPEFLALDKSR